VIVTLLASTAVHTLPGFTPDPDATRADSLVEFAGRSCYQSFDKPNPATAANDDYLANIIEQGHFSVMEHATATFYAEGVSRNLTHELVRHRHLSYSQLSQRFVDESKRGAGAVIPPAFRKDNRLGDLLQDVETVAFEAYDKAVEILTDDHGKPRKQAREAARFLLPSGMDTSIVVTGNMRAWRDFLGKRWSVHADAEIREFAGAVLAELDEIAPGCFQDIPEEPYA
jgi:thymidylate synthase (FAD)